MTPRERWLALLSGKEPDRMPTDHMLAMYETIHGNDRL